MNTKKHKHKFDTFKHKYIYHLSLCYKMETENILIYPHHSKFNPQKFPNFKLPKIIGYFSLDKDRNFVPNASNLKYIRMPNNKRIQYDLNLGYENVQHKPDGLNEKINHLLRFIVQNKKKLLNEVRVLNFDVVCFRGLLRLLLCTPYEDKENWSILVTRYKGVLYLCGHDTDKKIAWRQSITAKLKKILSYGFKFEQYLLTGKVKKNN